jgi:DNA-binding CsgD family transcriptional regulator
MTKPQKPNETLTPTEFKIYIATVTQAKGGVALAQEFKRNVYTVKHHLKKIYVKMGVSTSLELLVQYWYRELHPSRERSLQKERIAA